MIGYKRFAITCLAALSASLSQAETLTLFSDSGLPVSVASEVIAYPNDGSATFDGNSTVASSPPEGTKSWRTTSTTFAGWGINYSTPRDFSRFASGEIRFWVYAANGNILLQIKDATDNLVLTKQLDIDLGWNASMQNKWVQFRVSLQGLDLSSIKNPFLFTAQTPNDFSIDNVRYVDSTVFPIFDVSVLDNATNRPADLSWESASPGAWTVANQHLQLDLDPDIVAWGVQIYTDNTASDASPQFDTSKSVSGQPGSDPAGLVDATTLATSLPLAWTIKDSSISVPSAADPANTGDLNSFQWLFMKDKGTPTIQATNTTAFANGDPYIIMKTNQGIHFGGAPTEFGADNPPNNVFLEANFANALTPRSYRTNKLTVEYFTP